MNTEATPAAEHAEAASPFIAWIKAEADFIRAKQDEIRDGDLDETTDEPLAPSLEETSSRVNS